MPKWELLKMRKNSKKLLVQNNKILPVTSQSQLLKVINYYCLPDFSHGARKFFFEHNLRRKHTVASTSKNTVASTSRGSSSCRDYKLFCNNLWRIAADLAAYLVIKYDHFFIDWMQLPCYIKSHKLN